MINYDIDMPLSAFKAVFLFWYIKEPRVPQIHDFPRLGDYREFRQRYRKNVQSEPQIVFRHGTSAVLAVGVLRAAISPTRNRTVIGLVRNPLLSWVSFERLPRNYPALL